MSGIRRRLLYAKPKEMPNYLCFTALEDGIFSLRIGQQIGTRFYQYIEYSVDECETWNRTDNADNTEITITTPTITTGNKIYWRGSGTYISNYFTVARYSNFSSTGKFDASGNIASLCGLKNFNNWEATANECQFAYLFANTKIVNADNLVLPKFNKNRVYYHTFENCIEMTVMPALPDQDVLYSDAYISMFQGCTSLVSAKPLPLTTLANGCYSQMFKNCSSLVNAPELPATTLADNCYYEMLSGTAIETAPLLNAINIAISCYRSMFYNCSRLVNIQDELPATTLYERCYQSMFERCTSLTKVPRLPATTMATYCYYSMFNLTNLTGPFILPATNLAGTTQCYANMLRCKATYVKMLAITLGTSSLNYWLYNVPNVSTSIFVKHIDAQWTTTGNSGVPTNWKVIYYDSTLDKYYLDQQREIECDKYGNPFYINDGLVFQLDGIDKGDKEGYWTDLIGGYDFQIPSGVSSISDGMVFENPHTAMRHLPQAEKLATSWQNATVEVVCTYQQTQSFPWCSGYNEGTCFCFYNGTVGINMGYTNNPQFKIPSDISEDGTLHTFSVTASDCYADMTQLTQQGDTYFNAGAYMDVGSRNNGNWYYGTIKSIRIYSRQLTYAERVVNAKVDNIRFNLGLTI